MLRIIERALPWMLVAAISANVVMFREMGVIATKLEAVMKTQEERNAIDAEVRGEFLRLQGLIVNHERRRHFSGPR